VAWTNTVTPKSAAAATLAFTTANLNDVVCVSLLASSGTATITLSGGNVTTWNYFGASTPLTQSSGFSERQAWGLVTTVGASTITGATTAGSISDIQAAEFKPPAGTTSVALDNAQAHTSGATTTMACSSLTPSGATDLFWGTMVPINSATAGSTSGFTYFVDPSTSVTIAYSLAAPSPSAPTAPTSGGAGWDSLDGTLIPTVTAAGYAPRPNVEYMAVRRGSVF
jgi:hypothetical protein